MSQPKISGTSSFRRVKFIRRPSFLFSIIRFIRRASAIFLINIKTNNKNIPPMLTPCGWIKRQEGALVRYSLI